MKKNKLNAPFNSKAKKLTPNKPIVEVPGPGQYPTKGIKDSIGRKMWGKMGVFGCTERRFAQFSSIVIFFFECKIENAWTW